MTNSPQSKRELRCHCGSLMARVIPEGIELKCRRCKRVVIVPLAPRRQWMPVDLSAKEAAPP